MLPAFPDDVFLDPLALPGSMSADTRQATGVAQRVPLSVGRTYMPLTLQDALDRLENVKQSGNGYTARCPAHEDNNNSLSIALGESNKLLLKCHTGCPFEDILSALGQNGATPKVPRQTRDVRPNLTTVRKDLTTGVKTTPVTNPSEIVATYDYLNPAGDLVHQTVRFEPKAFRQRQPNPNGDGWLYSLGDIEPLLYNLPDLLERDDEVVYLVEGEKDADRLSSIDILATTAPMGAGKWRDSYTETLRGRVVVVVPDNDDPGRKHAQAAARALYTAAQSVYVVELPDLAKKGDVSDWLDAEGSAGQLIQLASDSQPWSPPPPISLIDLPKIARDGIPKISWLIEGWLAQGDIAMLAGAGGIGKSTTAAHLAVAVAKGETWLDIAVTKPLRVLYLDEEQGEADTARLFLRLDGICSNLMTAAGQGISLATEDGFAKLASSIEILSPDLVILDSVQQTFGATNENDSAEIGKAYRKLFELRDLHGTTFLLLHHKRKTSQLKSDILELVRGSTAHGTQCSTVWFAEPAAPGKINIRMAKRRGAKKLTTQIAYDEPQGPNGPIVLTSYGSPDEGESATEQCADLIITFLASVPYAKSSAIDSIATNAGFSRPSVRRALTNLMRWDSIEKPQRGVYRLKTATNDQKSLYQPPDTNPNVIQT